MLTCCADRPATRSRRTLGEQVNFVFDEPLRRLAFESRQLCRRSACDRYVSDPQDQISLRRARPGAAYALLFDRLDTFADAGSVPNGHRVTIELEMDLDHVARRAGIRRNDRGVAA